MSAIDVESVVASSAPAPCQVQIVFDKVCIDVKAHDKTTKRILHEVSGTFGPNEMTAIMGPSGSGKTTMLNAITGKTKPTSGSIHVNGKPFNSAAMKPITALVPQDDLLTPVLTCSEALMEAAAFKTKYTVPEARARTTELLTTFTLLECKDVMIGHPEGRKGLSGGQKKRLSVALELMGNPSLLYLDEPTSGLDSVSALSLVQLLSSLAKRGATIIATIHQPSAAAFFAFDTLLVLAKGKMCYRGPISPNQPMTFLQSAGFACPVFYNPADFIMEVLVQPSAQEALQRQLLLELSDGSTPKKTYSSTAPTLTEIVGAGTTFASSYATQFKTLVLRNMRVMAREPGLARARVGSNIVMGVVMGVLYWDLGRGQSDITERIALILFSMIFMMLTAVLPTILTVLPELAVVKKEHANNWYALRPYYLAKLIADTPLLVLPPLLYTLIMSFMTGLHDGSADRFFRLYLATLATHVIAHSFAMVISCASPSLAVAIFTVPISILPMILFAGFFKNVTQITWAFRWFSYVSFFRYAWEAFNIAAFEDLPLNLPSPVPGVPLTGTFILADRLAFESPTGDFADLYWIDIGIIIAYALLLRLIAFFALAWRVTR